MTPRENVLSLLGRRGFDFIPLEFVLCPSQEAEYKKRIQSDLPYGEYFKFPFRNIPDLKLLDWPPVDWSAFYDRELKPGVTFDFWGVAHEPGGSEACHMTQMRHPMAGFDSLEQYEAYPYPDFVHGSDAHMKAEVEKVHSQGLAALGWMQMSIWEPAWYLRSMEKLMVDMMVEDPKAAYHLDRITAQTEARARAFARAGCDALFLGDDIGMQSTTLMSPDLYRTWLKPRIKRVIDSARALSPDILVLYHSCGFVTPMIPDLIEVGVDVLNPVQPESMDFEEIHKQFGHQLSFHGTIGTQALMPFGSPDAIKQAIKKHLDIAGAKGGLFPCPTHIIEPEVPWENIQAYVDACREYLH